MQFVFNAKAQSHEGAKRMTLWLRDEFFHFSENLIGLFFLAPLRLCAFALI
jgi:hypothetical protein